MRKRTLFWFRPVALTIALATTAAPATGADQQIASVPSAPSVSQFLTPDGRFDLERARAVGYEGPVNLEGFDSRQDSKTGELVFKLGAAAGAVRSPDDVYWQEGFGVPGLNGEVYAAVVYGGSLVVGGNFTVAGATLVSNIAAWDGSAWSALEFGMDDGVFALTVFNSQLIAGGNFTNAGGTAANRIAAWNGSS